MAKEEKMRRSSRGEQEGDFSSRGVGPKRERPNKSFQYPIDPDPADIIEVDIVGDVGQYSIDDQPAGFAFGDLIRADLLSLRDQEVEKPPMGMVKFFSYRKGGLDSALRDEIARICVQEDDFEELPDVTQELLGGSSRIISRGVARGILENGIQPQNLEEMIVDARQRLVSVLQGMEGHLDKSAQEILAITGKRMEGLESGRRISFLALVQRPYAQFLYNSLPVWKKDGDENIFFERDNGPFQGAESYPDATMHRWTTRLDRSVLDSHRQSLEQQRENPVARFLLHVLEKRNAQPLIACRRGELVEFDGESISLSDVDTFLAPFVLDSEFLKFAIFADVLGEIFPFPYSQSGNEGERDLNRLHSLTGMFAGEEIPRILAPVEVVPTQTQIAELNQQIGEKEDKIKNIKSSRDAAQRRSVLQREIGVLRRQLRAIDGTGKETREDMIKRMLKERVPADRPRSSDYQTGKTSTAYKAAARQYESLSRKYPDIFVEPDPKDYEGGEESAAFKQDYPVDFAYRVVSQSAGAANLDESSLI